MNDLPNDLYVKIRKNDHVIVYYMDGNTWDESPLLAWCYRANIAFHKGERMISTNTVNHYFKMIRSHNWIEPLRKTWL